MRLELAAQPRLCGPLVKGRAPGPPGQAAQPKYPRQESDLCTRFRKPLLYPLSYEGTTYKYLQITQIMNTKQMLATDSQIDSGQSIAIIRNS